ncbi:hypothetical protein PTSG_04217 [Salpingoeca rosetta]|uniref:CLASP N-terminal domain-containing protein n=1 Tax=Salpingoeca rosetta (strain ATCC 50818 / BSB-021) TaxID=946362 RepID=F2U6X7_SALR5|nr:uncharacterized protein PTSG_04217 [Salpingoeca rosetta]EGD83609.1 hypothetical protein PTSG_04217 [Salpingoeca rosetta]|eukprot:XP_004995113.1 hypothetical protein PTSG_04217 [Salpingoeca rosetta]
MFRHGTAKELCCLLWTLDPTFTAADLKAEGIKTEAEAGQHVSERLQACFEKLATTEALHWIENDPHLCAELESMYKQMIDNKHTPDHREMAQSFAEGVVSVLLRDLVQTLHGRRASLLEGINGVKMLVAGMLLGSLYTVVDAPQQGVQGLVLKVLRRLSSNDIWWQALLRYGPAPPRSPKEEEQSQMKKRNRRRAKTVAFTAPNLKPPPPIPSPPISRCPSVTRHRTLLPHVQKTRSVDDDSPFSTPGTSPLRTALSSTANSPSPHRRHLHDSHGNLSANGSPTHVSTPTSPTTLRAPLRHCFSQEERRGSEDHDWRERYHGDSDSSKGESPHARIHSHHPQQHHQQQPGGRAKAVKQRRRSSNLVHEQRARDRETHDARDTYGTHGTRDAPATPRRTRASCSNIHMNMARLGVADAPEPMGTARPDVERTGVFRTLHGDVRIVYPEWTEQEAAARAHQHSDDNEDEFDWFFHATADAPTFRRRSCCF